MMSSIAAATGPLVQYNYAAANATLDNLARLRHHMGLPAVSVALGAIAEVGILSKNEALLAQLIRAGIIPMTESEYLQAIELGIRSQIHNSAAMEVSSGSRQAILADSNASSYVLTGLGLGHLREMHANGQYQNLA